MPSLASSQGTVEVIPIPAYNLCFLGYGNVNRTLVRLFEDRAAELRTRHGITYRITGVASTSLGWIADPEGLDLEACMEEARVAQTIPSTRSGQALSTNRETDRKPSNIREWLAADHADVLFEATSLNLGDG